MFEKKLMEMFYGKAATPSDLPWHQEEPSPLLIDAAAGRKGSKRALDLGCGAGVFAVTLAGMGFDVTAVDFVPKALDFARRRAEEAAVDVRWVEADLLEWPGDGPYDLILDSGTFHNMTGAAIRSLDCFICATPVTR